ncbi:hypothetical protein F4776DRAFT_624835 [Hypoxylon sp. NC0597]|nr:hypothetical protein F4776DRAFT_624835 [Hypoxylon sp. NC0597]
MASSSAPRAVSDDTFYYMARDIICGPSDIANLSLTCRRLFRLLEPMLYRADVWTTRDREIEQERHEFGKACLYGIHEGDDIDTRLSLQNSRVSVTHVPALHWATLQVDTDLGLAVARKSIKAALDYWPNYLHVRCVMLRDMTPLQLAAINGLGEMVDELIEASPFVDARLPITDDDFRLDEYSPFPTLYFHREYYKAGGLFFKPTISAVGIAIAYGRLHIAETLARLTEDLTETPTETHKDLLPLLRMAALFKMPSVIRILLDRSYQELDGPMNYNAFHIAARADGNEETLRVLLDSGVDINAVDDRRFDALDWAFQDYKDFGTCMSNAIFLANHLPPEMGPRYFFREIVQFLARDDTLPLIKALLRDGAGILDRHIRSLRHVLLNDLPCGKIRIDPMAGPEMRDYLLHHPGLKFSESGNSIDFWKRQWDERNAHT